MSKIIYDIEKSKNCSSCQFNISNNIGKEELINIRNDLLFFAEKIENEVTYEHFEELMNIIEKVHHYI